MFIHCWVLAALSQTPPSLPIHHHLPPGSLAPCPCVPQTSYPEDLEVRRREAGVPVFVPYRLRRTVPATPAELPPEACLLSTREVPVPAARR